MITLDINGKKQTISYPTHDTFDEYRSWILKRYGKFVRWPMPHGPLNQDLKPKAKKFIELLELAAEAYYSKIRDNAMPCDDTYRCPLCVLTEDDEGYSNCRICPVGICDDCANFGRFILGWWHITGGEELLPKWENILGKAKQYYFDEQEEEHHFQYMNYRPFDENLSLCLSEYYLAGRLLGSKFNPDDVYELEIDIYEGHIEQIMIRPANYLKGREGRYAK